MTILPPSVCGESDVNVIVAGLLSCILAIPVESETVYPTVEVVIPIVTVSVISVNVSVPAVIVILAVVAPAAIVNGDAGVIL